MLLPYCVLCRNTFEMLNFIEKRMDESEKVSKSVKNMFSSVSTLDQLQVHSSNILQGMRCIFHAIYKSIFLICARSFARMWPIHFCLNIFFFIKNSRRTKKQRRRATNLTRKDTLVFATWCRK